MNQDHRETIGGIAAAVTGELLVVIAIFVLAGFGQWVGQ